ncbi:hypothetical protein [Candidatus Clostridium radicumherbarum]|uniref:Lipoprotein n=1 Tax=Candidatus Clostridium radicumherbarum TaxID=3381662 RepID=A0ABW8TXW4_9CLOT
MKKRFLLLIISAITVSLVFTGCKKTTTETTNTDTKVATNVERKPIGETKVDEKKEDAKPLVKEEVKTDNAATEQKTETTQPAASTTSKTTTSTTTTSNITKPVTKPSTTTPTSAPMVQKPSGIAEINDAFRSKYFGLEPSMYTGSKSSTFNAIILDVAKGNLSKTQAVAELKDIQPWTEGNITYTILTPTINIYSTASNDVTTILKEIRDNGLFTGDMYSNAYVYYDSSIKQNRIVMIGIPFLQKTAVTN